MSTNNRGTAVIINICMVLKQQISPTLENTYPPQTPIGPDTTCISDDNCRHASQMDACPVALTLGEVECWAEGSAAFHWYYLYWRGGADMADIPHNNPSPYKHPLGRPPPAYEMMTVDMHHTWMHVLWGQVRGGGVWGKRQWLSWWLCEERMIDHISNCLATICLSK